MLNKKDKILVILLFVVYFLAGSAIAFGIAINFF